MTEQERGKRRLISPRPPRKSPPSLGSQAVTHSNMSASASASARPISIGVVGCGHWGPNHVRVFSQLRESQVLACADPDEKRLQGIQSQYPSVRTFTDFRKMLGEVPLDAVVISAPTRFHAGLVKEALGAGCHVLCEKPLCLDPDEGHELVEFASKCGRILMVGHVFLFNSGIRRLKELLRQPDIGAVNYLRATRTNLGPVRYDVNSVYDLATHDISIFNYLLDARPLSVSAVGGCFLQKSIEDVAFISMRYPGNRLAHIQVSWLDPKKLREIVVVAERRMLVWDDLGSQGPITIYDKGIDRPSDYSDYGQFQLLAREGDVTMPRVKLEEPLKAQNRFFLESIRSGQLASNDGPFAVDVLRVLRAIDQSLKSNGALVDVQ